MYISMFSFSQRIPTTSERKTYVLRALLDGHTGAVACISAHPLGTHVACGGEEGTLIWNLPGARLLQSPTGAADRGITTAIVWLTKPDDTDDGIAYGTDDGYLCIWRRSRKEDTFTEVYCNRLTGGQDGQEISAMAYDASSGLLAVTHRSEAIHRFALDGVMHPTPLKSVKIPKHWPQAVAFGQTGVRGPELWSFGREDGVIYILDADSKILKAKTTGTVIGHAVINLKEDAIILDDVSEGVALFKLSTTERVKIFLVPRAIGRRSRNIAFLEGGRTIISGSDHGKVYVFDRRTGQVTDVIPIGCNDWVQSIATAEVAGSPLILAGRSGENIGKTSIQVWEKGVEPARKVTRSAAFEQGRWLLLVLLSALFILENVLHIPALNLARQWAMRVMKELGLPRILV